jgi:enoyl-CoA hydratase/carnithine racemase
MNDGEHAMRLGSVSYETRGKVAILTLDEPAKLNALSAGIRSGILEGLKKADADDTVRVAIITGSGDKAFCAGADIGDFDFAPEKSARLRDRGAGGALRAGKYPQAGDIGGQRHRLWRRI